MRAIDRFAVLEGNDDDVLRAERAVCDTAGLDGHDAGRSIDAAGVAPGQDDQPRFDNREIGAVDTFFQFFVGHIDSSLQIE